MNVITFPKNEWKDIKSRLDKEKMVYTIRVDCECGKYRVDDVLKTEWGQEVKIISVEKVGGGLDGLKNVYKFFGELTKEMKEQLNDYNEMEIISFVGISKS